MKRAFDTVNKKEVAIKILKLGKNWSAKKLMLESFFKEISILSRCRHQNIVKILDASFSGTLIKEAVSLRKPSIEYSKIDL